MLLWMGSTTKKSGPQSAATPHPPRGHRRLFSSSSQRVCMHLQSHPVRHLMLYSAILHVDRHSVKSSPHLHHASAVFIDVLEWG